MKTNKPIQIALRVDKATHQWLQEVAQNNQETVSEVIRAFIKQIQQTHKGTRKVLEMLEDLEPNEALAALDMVIAALKEKINNG